MENVAKTTHPLILLAAVSVTVASLAAAAHFTGLIPVRSEGPTPAVATAAAPGPSTAAAPQGEPAQTTTEASSPVSPPKVQHPPREASRKTARHESESNRQTRRGGDDWRSDGGNRRVSDNSAGIDVIPSSSAPESAPATVQVQPPVCHDCGTVENIREVAARGEGSGLGAIAGGVLGGILGHQVGRGSGKDLATIAGAVGGAVAGHQVEKNVRTEKQLEVTVRFDDGSVRSFPLPNASWRIGERVRLRNGALVALTDPQR